MAQRAWGPAKPSPGAERLDFRDFWQILGLRPVEDRILGRIAADMVHPSAMQRNRERQNNFQRLEWLGDAVLNMYVSTALLSAHPSLEEGKLSRLRTRLTRSSGVAQFARALHFDEIVILGPDTPPEDSVLCDCFEAMLGSIHMHFKGNDVGQAIISRIVEVMMEKVQELDYVPQQSPKELLSMWIQAFSSALPPPKYVVFEDVSEKEPAKRFHAQVYAGPFIASGSGPSKQVAEENAAQAIFKPPVRPSITTYLSAHEVKNRLQKLLSDRGSPGASIAVTFIPEPGPCNVPFQVKVEVLCEPALTSQEYGETRKEAEINAYVRLLESLETGGVSQNAEDETVDFISMTSSLVPKESPKPSRTQIDMTTEDDSDDEVILSPRNPPKSLTDRTDHGSETLPWEAKPREDTSTGASNAGDSRFGDPDVGKPYKNRLQELLIKHNKTVTYQTLKQEGPPHAPIFTVRASVENGDNYNSVAQGRSKKEAEEKAAQGLYESMLPSLPKTTTSPTSDASFRAKMVVNPIGSLLELYQKSHSAPPMFDFESNVDGSFTCTIYREGRIMGTATAFNKKEAKQNAALDCFRSQNLV